MPIGSRESARRLFAMSRPIEGTLVETYLRHRGITALHETANLRFHPRCYYRPDNRSKLEIWPAMIAAVTDLDGKIMARIAPGSTRPDETRRRSKRQDGRWATHWPRRQIGVAGDVLAAGEGIETVLSLRSVMPAMPMMAALSSAHLAAILFPARYVALHSSRQRSGGRKCVGDPGRARNGRRDRADILSPIFDDFNDDLAASASINCARRSRMQIAPEDVARFMSFGVNPHGAGSPRTHVNVASVRALSRLGADRGPGLHRGRPCGKRSGPQWLRADYFPSRPAGALHRETK